jgi:hypothetical protein
MTNHRQPHTWVIRSANKVVATASEKHSANRLFTQWVKSSKTKGEINYGEVVTLHHFEVLQRIYRPSDKNIDPRVLIVWINSEGERQWAIAHERKVMLTENAIRDQGLVGEIFVKKIHDIVEDMIL